MLTADKIKKVLKRNKSVHVKMCILHFITILMHEFHNNSIKKNFGLKVKLFKETDIRMKLKQIIFIKIFI